MNQDALLALIGQIYDAAADPGRWPVVLQEIADAFGAREASLSAVSTQSVPWLVAPRTDPAFLQSYGAHYHPLNLFWQRMAQLPAGTAVTDQMVLPKTTLHASQFFNEWSRPQGYLSVMGATLATEKDWRVEFVMPGKSEFGPEHLKLYGAIAPHLKRAVQLTRRLQAAEFERAYALAALEGIGQGVVIVDHTARVLFTNHAAEALQWRPPAFGRRAVRQLANGNGKSTLGSRRLRGRSPQRIARHGNDLPRSAANAAIIACHSLSRRA